MITEFKYVLDKNGNLFLGSKENKHFFISGKLDKYAIISAGFVRIPSSKEEFDLWISENKIFEFFGHSEYYGVARFRNHKMNLVNQNLVSEGLSYEELSFMSKKFDETNGVGYVIKVDLEKR